MNKSKRILIGGVAALAVLASLVLVLGGWTRVDSTEHCVLTRYGNVVERKMDTGLNFTPFADATCFGMTEQNFPEGAEGKEIITATTADPVTVQGDVAITWSYDPATIYEVFQEKRSPEAVDVEVRNAIREGYRNAINSWTVDRIFSAERAKLADDVKQQIQAKLNDRARVHQVFVRDIQIPPQIEEARIGAARQAQVLDQAQKQFTIDSVNARAQVMKAEAEAHAKQLEAQAYASNPALLELEAAKAMAGGLAQACKGVQTCVIGGSVMDTWKGP